MAARGLMAFHTHTRSTALPPIMMVPMFISWVGKLSRTRHARFLCSHSKGAQKVDMPKYTEKFAQRMAMAGLKPHHRIAMAVSGGPDSMALCILAADWKSDNFDAAPNKSKSIDDLLAIVVDHGLRTESAEEANLVHDRIINMGISCEVARCEWLDGRPKIGHLQEAARDKRYETLLNICIQQRIDILLIAHHADDQAELFILRLSRNSGVLGLGGMPFTSQLFQKFPLLSGGGSNVCGILSVRPLLDFSKEDLYNVCRCGNQQWVEDPTNRSPLYARNRIRMSLNKLSSPIFKAELQAAISACRRTRLHVDNFCHLLLNQAVTVMLHGYAVIDLGTLRATEVKDIYLTKFAALVLQFISQRHKPVRGKASKLILSYFRTFPCKTCLTVAGCYLCPAPGSKGTKVLVCCSVMSSLPPMMKSYHASLYGAKDCFSTSDFEEIVNDIEAYLNRSIPDASSVPFLDMISSESVLTEAKNLGILSHYTHNTIVSLQKEESEIFKSKNADFKKEDDIRSEGVSPSNLIYRGQVGYFMNRFVLDWNGAGTIGRCFCSCCIIGDQMAAEVRHMVDADWIYLTELSKKTKLGGSPPQNHPMDYAILSANKALVSLKCIPVAARRALPVLVNANGVLLSIPSIGFSCCPHLAVSALFNPRIPLGGGHASFL